MLTLKQIDNNVYHLTETSMGWHDTTTTNWYYDLDQKLVSEKRDFPKGLYTRELTDIRLDWFNKYYLPKLQGEIYES